MRNEMFKTHGMSKTLEYRSWRAMKIRCFNPNYPRYSDWGGRGITVCDRWKNSFEDFLADMGSRPTAKHSLDRIDNNADYSPKNCKWSTRVEQDNNKRNNHLITIDDVTLTIAQWAKKMNISGQLIQGRLKNGWSEYKAVMTPIYGKIRLITIGNETYTIAQWEKKMSYGVNVIFMRLKTGWSEFDAVMTPVRFRSKSTKKLSKTC